VDGGAWWSSWVVVCERLGFMLKIRCWDLRGEGMGEQEIWREK
jgi:proteasome lid subunit RPN8/RPN11